MEAWQERLEAEERQLDERTRKLEAFIRSDKFNTATPVQRTLMRNQLMAMRGYLTILRKRLCEP